MIVSQSQLAEILGVTSRSIRLWEKNGLPKIDRGKYDAGPCVAWWSENIFSAGDELPDIAEAKTQYWSHKARLEKVKADEAESLVAPKEEFVDAWSWRISEMRNGLLALPLRLAPMVAGKTELEVRKKLDDELWHILDKYSRTGKWTPDNPETEKIRNREK